MVDEAVTSLIFGRAKKSTEMNKLLHEFVGVFAFAAMDALVCQADKGRQTAD